MQPTTAQLHFAHARSHSERYQQASASAPRNDETGSGAAFFSRQPPIAAHRFTQLKRIAHRIDDDLAMMRRLL